MALYSITGYEHVKAYSRGDIDGGFGAVFAPPSGPGLIPFSSETADGMPKHQQWTQEFRVESTTAGPLSWQAGLYYVPRRLQGRELQLRLAAAGSAQDGYERIRQKNDALAVFGHVELRDHAGRPACAAACATRQDKKELNVEDYNTTAFVPCVLLGKCTLAQLAAQEPDGNLSASTRRTTS